MIVTKQYNLDSIKSSGLVGLSPSHFDAECDLFIEKMKSSGAIDKSVFSMSIASGND